VKIIPICSADSERLRSNRFYRFCGLDLGKGVDFLCFWRVVWGLERVNFLSMGLGRFFRGGGGRVGRLTTYSETSYDFDMHSHALAPSNFNNCFIFMNIVTIDVLIPPNKPLRTNRMFTT
jgi:hypothetical protein